MIYTAGLSAQSAPTYRQKLSEATRTILAKFDTLMCKDCLSKCNGILESKHIGEAGHPSKNYTVYIELTKTASEKELLVILADANERSAIRGYALMGYILFCDKQKKKEKALNYTFDTEMTVGCIGSTCTFKQLNKAVRVRRMFDPEPRYFKKDLNEQKIIEHENEIRKEQGEPSRTE